MYYNHYYKLTDFFIDDKGFSQNKFIILMVYLGLFICVMKQNIERNTNWNKDVCAWPTQITNPSNNIIQNFKRNRLKNGKLDNTVKKRMER